MLVCVGWFLVFPALFGFWWGWCNIASCVVGGLVGAGVLGCSVWSTVLAWCVLCSGFCDCGFWCWLVLMWFCRLRSCCSVAGWLLEFSWVFIACVGLI